MEFPSNAPQILIAISVAVIIGASVDQVIGTDPDSIDVYQKNIFLSVTTILLMLRHLSKK